MFIFPHGIHVDPEGNVWVTDAQGPDGKEPNRNGKGHAVYQFNPEGQVLLTVGKPGVAGDGTGDLLSEPCDVVTLRTDTAGSTAMPLPIRWRAS